MNTQKTFGPWDYAVFGVMVASSIAIGIYYAVTTRKENDLDKFLFASKSMAFLPVSLSILASFRSSILMLGVPAEGYAFGMQIIIGELAVVVGLLIQQILLLDFLQKLALVSPFELLEKRFRSRVIRLVATTVGCFREIVYMGIVLYGQGVALQTVTGLSVPAAIFTSAGAVVLYTSILVERLKRGGLKAVIWTDVLQTLFMIAGLLSVAIKGTIEAGGMTETWTTAVRAGRLDFNVENDITMRHTVQILLLGSIFHGFGFLFRPAVLQRISSTKHVKDAHRALFLTLMGFPLINYLAITCGVVAYSYYERKRCDPVVSDRIRSYNQMLPLMILDIFNNYPGLSGLFLASVCSASLSSLSSSLSAVSNIVVEDFVKPHYQAMTERRGLLIAKLTVVVAGAVSSGIAFLVSKMGTPTISQIFEILNACFTGPGAALFYLGVFFPFVNMKSAIAAVLTGLGTMAWLVIGSMVSPGVRQFRSLPPAPTDMCPDFNSTLHVTQEYYYATEQPKYTGTGLDHFFSLSYVLYKGFAILLVLTLGIIFSVITRGNQEPVDPVYVAPLGHQLCRKFPRRLRRHLRLDTEDTEMETACTARGSETILMAVKRRTKERVGSDEREERNLI